jgi:DNA (cytosine-5)-methyltransferase 1
LNAFDQGDTRTNTVILFEATRVDDVRIYKNYSPTVATYWGTGGARVPYVFPIDDARELDKNQNGTGVGLEGAPAYTLDRVQAPAVVTNSFVRRLTPTECERLQGFPDEWTSDQADSNRYKQIGNAVAVPVVTWIILRIVCDVLND